MLNVNVGAVIVVRGGEDRGGRTATMWGTNALDIKLSASDTNGELFVGEIPNVVGFGPPRHLHHDQDEWFYVVAGRFAIEIGGRLIEAAAGDSAFCPRKVPHAWAPLGPEPSTMIFTLTPAGDFDGFVRAADAHGRLPTADEANEIFEAHGMQTIASRSMS